jgi:tungstate transport system substrate-binding protein
VRRCVAVTVGLCGLLLACRQTPKPVILATTTSVASSGLLDRLLPAYRRPVHPTPVGSGIALDLLARQLADVAISHAPEQEAAALKTHPGWWYRKLLYNDFVLVGPPDDPAHVRNSPDAATAMRRIASAGVLFVSRGDGSGTHERERQLWVLAGIRPVQSRLVVAGTGMGQTLRIADSMNAYTLTDRGTLESFAGALRAVVLYSGDRRLINTYAIVVDPANVAGFAFATWLVEGEGQQVLTDIATRQIKGFAVWPAGSPRDTPAALPR